MVLTKKFLHLTSSVNHRRYFGSNFCPLLMPVNHSKSFGSIFFPLLMPVNHSNSFWQIFFPTLSCGYSQSIFCASRVAHPSGPVNHRQSFGIVSFIFLPQLLKSLRSSFRFLFVYLVGIFSLRSFSILFCFLFGRPLITGDYWVLQRLLCVAPIVHKKLKFFCLFSTTSPALGRGSWLFLLQHFQAANRLGSISPFVPSCD